MQYKNPLLLLSLSDMTDQDQLDFLISRAVKLTEKNSTLYILILEDYNGLILLIKDLVQIYDTARHYNDLQNHIEVDVLFGENYKKLFKYCDWSVVLVSSDHATNAFDNIAGLPTERLTLPHEHTFKPGKQELGGLATGFKAEYDTVAVGGTFDHLHDGHKILLTATSFLTRRRLIVGVTGAELLVNKKYAEYLDTYEERVESVRRFIKLINFDQRLDIFMINDVCGPTAQIADIDALVVSLETAKGGDYVNKVRAEKGMPPLKIFTVCVVGGGTEDDNFKNKLSSTYLRKFDAESASATAKAAAGSGAATNAAAGQTS